MRRSIICLVGIAAAVVLAYAFFSKQADPRSRIERGHGVVIPASATDLQFGGDSERGFLDRGAVSAFEITSSDLPSFVSQLKVHPGLTTFVPGNPEYQLPLAKPAATAITRYSCDSSVGDWLHVEIWPVDETKLAVQLYTDWN